MSNKKEPITLEEILGCTALKSIIVQSVIKGKAADSSKPIEKIADEIMEEEGMQAYIMRLSYQMQKAMRDRTKDDPLPW